jgi:hypothetical protein
MATQNLVSAVITPDIKTKIDQAFTLLGDALSFTVSLQPGDKKAVIKAGDTFVPFIDKADKVVDSHPEILPAVFDKAEFKKDNALRQDLIPIRNKLVSLAEAIDNTLFAASSDCLVAALDVYAAVGRNLDKVPGLNTIHAEMAEFFKKSGTKATTAQPPAKPA